MKVTTAIVVFSAAMLLAACGQKEAAPAPAAAPAAAAPAAPAAAPADAAAPNTKDASQSGGDVVAPPPK